MKTLMLGLAAALVAMGPAPALTTEEDHVVQISDKSFQPDKLMIKVGERVTWKNVDTSDHTVTDIGRPSEPGFQSRNEFDSGVLKPGQTWSYTFTKEGNFQYHCTIHPKMIGVVVVSQ